MAPLPSSHDPSAFMAVKVLSTLHAKISKQFSLHTRFYHLSDLESKIKGFAQGP